MDPIGIVIFAVLVAGIWFSYRLFMRGDTARDRVNKLLPKGFTPDIFHQKGDTYIGFEKKSNRLVLIDWPHVRVISPREIRGLEPVSETMMGVTHHWLQVDTPDNPGFSQYRIWFQFRRAPRELWRERLAVLRNEPRARGDAYRAADTAKAA